MAISEAVRPSVSASSSARAGDRASSSTIADSPASSDADRPHLVARRPLAPDGTSATTSSAPSQRIAPVRSSSLHPRADASHGAPGTASTDRPSSSAKSAVISAPERSPASTTTTASARAATIRLRAGKRQGAAGCARPVLGHDEVARVEHARREGRVPTRRRVVDPAAEHGDGRSADLQRPLVCGGVDAEGEAAHHDRTAPRERTAERACEREGGRTGPPGTDDRDHRAAREGIEHGRDGAAREQHRRRIVEVAETPWGAGAARGDHVHVHRAELATDRGRSKGGPRARHAPRIGVESHETRDAW